MLNLVIDYQPLDRRIDNGLHDNYKAFISVNILINATNLTGSGMRRNLDNMSPISWNVTKCVDRIRECKGDQVWEYLSVTESLYEHCKEQQRKGGLL